MQGCETSGPAASLTAPFVNGFDMMLNRADWAKDPQ